MFDKLSLNKVGLLSEAELNLRLYKKALEERNAESAYIHLLNASKLKTAYAYALSEKQINEKAIAYMEIAKLAYMMGNSSKGRTLINKDIFHGLRPEVFFAFTELVNKPPQPDKLIMNAALPKLSTLNKQCEVGDIIMLDNVLSCCTLCITSHEPSIDNTISIISDYAICLTTSSNWNIFYLVHAKKFIYESINYMMFHGVNISSDLFSCLGGEMNDH